VLNIVCYDVSWPVYINLWKLLLSSMWHALSVMTIFCQDVSWHMYGYTFLCWVLVMPVPDVIPDLICMPSHEWYCLSFPRFLIIWCSCNRFYLNNFVIKNLYSDLYMCGSYWCSSAKWWTSRSRRRSARYARTSQWRPGTLQPIRGQTDAFKACQWSDHPFVDFFETPLYC
jgi:hypothetical protein